MAIMGTQLGVAASPNAKALLAAAAKPGVAPAQPNGTINLDNILALIPGEVVPLYIAGSGITGASIGGVGWIAVVFWTCFLLCALLRGQASKPPGASGVFSGVNWRLVLVSLIAFFLWAQAVTEHGPLVAALPNAAWGFFAMVFGVAAPLFVPASK